MELNVRFAPWLRLSLVVVGLAAIGYYARDAAGQRVPGTSNEVLLSKMLENVGGRQLAVTKLTYEPGASSMPHRHEAYLAVYVLSGQVESALDDEQPVVYRPGDAWYESHNQLHRVFRNPSTTEPFTVLVFALRDATHPANARDANAHSQ